MSAATPQVKAGAYAAARRDAARDQKKALPRMSTSLPHMHAARKPLFVWIDKGRIHTSDGKMRGADIAAALLDTQKESLTKRTLVLPTVREARALSKAMSRAKAATTDQLRLVRAARRTLDASLTMPWMSTVVVLTRALGARYWTPSDMDQDDLHAWGRLLGRSTGSNEKDLQGLFEHVMQGSMTRGALNVRINSQSESLMGSLMYPNAVNDAKAFTAMEAIGGLWKALCAADTSLRPYSIAARRTVAAIPQRPKRESNYETLVLPGGSIPFRENSGIWVVDPLDTYGVELSGGQLTAFGYDQGRFVATVKATGKGTWSIRQAYGREVFLIEEPFSGSPRYSRPDGSAWEQGVPPVVPVERTVPSDLALAGNI